MALGQAGARDRRLCREPRRADPRVAARTRRRVVGEPPKLRLLLLERQANRAIGWLSTVFGLGDNENSAPQSQSSIPKNPSKSPRSASCVRREVFATLLERSNRALDAPAPGVDAEFDRRLGDANGPAIRFI